ncbi:tetratricopeptide repeat protein [Bacillus shivajii]|uniref:tetratricopeptide repeat protein n=1 Tax=Bacillus shivajii TaxID=1983719 RepID=UPI001CFB0331|nr:tetratricopeptide repeat protein [Bacillus shivajii]UCZ54809.1 tetratricopeptide repeat protein [Bacillus shivajii]
MFSSTQWEEMSKWLMDNKDMLNENELKQWVEHLSKEQDQLLEVWSTQNELLEEIKDELTTSNPFSFQKEDETHTGISYFELGLYEEAIREFQAGLDGQQNSARLYLYLGFSQLYIEQPNEAKESFLNVLHRSKDPTEHHFALVGLGLQAGQEENIEEAIHYFEKSEVLLFNSDVVYNLGICYLLLKMPKEALQYFQKMVHKGETDSESYFWLGKCFESLGRNTEAMEAWYETIQRTKSKKLIRTLAFIFEENGNFSCAIYCYERLKSLGYNEAFVLHGMAWNYGLLDERKKSMEMFEELLYLEPTNINAMISYLWLLYRWEEIEKFKQLKERISHENLSHPLIAHLT